jgi:transposase
MGRSNKYTAEVKVSILNEYTDGHKSFEVLAKEYQVNPKTIYLWYRQYSEFGIIAFIDKPRNRSYSKELKEAAIHDYLGGKGSYIDIALKYEISSKEVLRKWVLKYNRLEPIQDYYPKGEVYMNQRKKTNVEERKEMVKYCLDHSFDYKATAELYDVSYAQIYQWVKKYKERGYEGLEDRRGKNKEINTLSEVETLEQKIKQLENQLELKDRETILLKKAKEVERRWYSPKQNKNHNT